MNANVHLLPAGQFVIAPNEAEALKLIKVLGLYSSLKRAELRFAPESSVFVIDEKHPTHWILAYLYRGFKEPEDNGYGVMCYPKSKVTLQAVNKCVTSLFPSNHIVMRRMTPGNG
jgi:hypothetical protein